MMPTFESPRVGAIQVICHDCFCHGISLQRWAYASRKICTTERFHGDKIDVFYENLIDAGTEAETKEFMSVCVQTAARYPLNDMISPVFIFERLCSIIYPVSTIL